MSKTLYLNVGFVLKLTVLDFIRIINTVLFFPRHVPNSNRNAFFLNQNEAKNNEIGTVYSSTTVSMN
ncbi:hypothetical protein LEP1GSC036_1446 [Leptospira weilii str. 2006001853]|uniref:Uncharacterized protein n=2 Tax=Leptospira weilii TaxID=28184 RepID=A0A828ZB93_9LEPT|nr:hypothetical protein LEP1GSC036_1446 [Leptospira weilii str. 2006001853]EMM74265.1 hypothetical protein LEP1GSC038_4712 [Leptospira weilii str. 2006001855]EMN46040.1 hypothetical protein LEP1GSC086_2194 [Leptospira weilii str. LNT 1234]